MGPRVGQLTHRRYLVVRMIWRRSNWIGLTRLCMMVLMVATVGGLVKLVLEGDVALWHCSRLVCS